MLKNCYLLYKACYAIFFFFLQKLQLPAKTLKNWKEACVILHKDRSTHSTLGNKCHLLRFPKCTIWRNLLHFLQFFCKCCFSSNKTYKNFFFLFFSGFMELLVCCPTVDCLNFLQVTIWCNNNCNFLQLRCKLL